MTISRDDLEDLRRQEREHRARIAEIESAVADLENERRVHQRVVDLIADERVVAALVEIAADPELAASAAVDVRGHCRARGVRLPDDITVEIELGDAEPTVRARHHDELFGADLVWSPSRGFDGRVHVRRSVATTRRRRVRATGGDGGR